MTWLVAILALPALLLAVIALPFHARVRGGVHQGDRVGVLGLSWAFGLVGVELRREGLALRLAGLRLRRRGARQARTERRRREQRRGHGEPRRSALARLRDGLAGGGRLLRMARRMARTLHLRLRLRGMVGTGDPADGAALCGAIAAARAVPGVEVDVGVDWLDELLELEAEGSARVWLPEVLTVAGLLFLRRENRAALRALAR